MFKKLILGAVVLAAGAVAQPQKAAAHGPFGPAFAAHAAVVPVHHGYRYGYHRSYRHPGYRHPGYRHPAFRHPAHRHGAFRHPAYRMPGPRVGFGIGTYGHPFYGRGLGPTRGFSFYFGR